MHGFLVGDFLAHELLAVDFHDFVASQESGTLGRTVLDDALHVDGVFANDKLYAHAREGALQVVGRNLCVFRGDIDRVGVEVGEYLRDGRLDERVEVDGVDILVVDDVQQVVQTVRTAVDDVQPVARKPVRKERTYQDADGYGNSQEERQISVLLFVHISSVLS